MRRHFQAFMHVSKLQTMPYTLSSVSPRNSFCWDCKAFDCGSSPGISYCCQDKGTQQNYSAISNEKNAMLIADPRPFLLITEKITFSFYNRYSNMN